MKAYLSGAIENASDEGKEWRDEISEWLSSEINHKVFNPLDVEKTLMTDRKSVV